MGKAVSFAGCIDYLGRIHTYCTRNLAQFFDLAPEPRTDVRTVKAFVCSHQGQTRKKDCRGGSLYLVCSKARPSIEQSP